jgi:hypothetical protein
MGKRENELAAEVDQFVEDYMEFQRLVLEMKKIITRVKKASTHNKALLDSLKAKFKIAPTEDNPGIMAGNMYTLIVQVADEEGNFNIAVKIN